jgi:UDP:flavonoid glycosyltransferase YjiC (YdhE family)
VPARVRAALAEDPRVATSAECWEAVRRLREVHGMQAANPFSYVEVLSPYLNLYGEPEEYLVGEDRTAFEPIAFFGSLAPEMRDRDSSASAPVFPNAAGRLRVYVSFGTVVWWYFAGVAEAALRVIAETLSSRRAQVVISLGGHQLPAEARAALQRPNVAVVDYADQWAALREADVFVTHSGLNSSHEAVFHGVPMISYPFFSDQPALSRRCQDLGLALGLSEAPQAPIEPVALLDAIGRIASERERFAARLREARSWELRTIAGRGAVLDRVLSFVGARAVDA